jgi:hypothetical protein
MGCGRQNPEPAADSCLAGMHSGQAEDDSRAFTLLVSRAENCEVWLFLERDFHRNVPFSLLQSGFS